MGEHHDHSGHNHDHHHGHGHAHAAGGHHHAHDHRGSGAGRLRAALILTAGFMLVEAVAGTLSGSLALLADAGHMLTDALSLALALFAVNISRKPADERRSYGYARMQVLAAFVNGISLLAVAVWIVIEAIQRLNSPVPILAGPMLVIAGIGLLVNLVSFLILSSGGGENLNVRGALAHVIGDLLGSVAAIVAAGVILLTGWLPADPILSVAVALLIFRTGLQLTRESGHVLLEGTPAGMDLMAVESGLQKAVPGLLEIHHVHAWALTPEQPMMTLHARLEAETKSDEAISLIERYLQKHHGVTHITVQIEYEGCSSGRH